jgi:membrane associated rhomboid family serine protease
MTTAITEIKIPDISVEENIETRSIERDERDEIVNENNRGWVTTDDLVEVTLDYAVDDPPEASSGRNQVVEFLQPAESEDNLPLGSESSILALVQVLRTNVGSLPNLNPRLGRRVKDFQFAQSERSNRYAIRPFGFVALFANLSDIRSDLRWAEDAAWRRENGKPYVSWEDFEARRSKGLQRPYLTYLLVLSHIVMMIWSFQANNWKMESMNVNPLAGPSSEALLKLGALNTREMIETASWYRLVTATFLHAGIIHLVMNAAVLAVLGRAIELNHGIIATFFLFFVPAVGGNVVSALMQPGYTLVGASGGIFGLIGACVADAILNWKLMFLVFKDRPGMSGCWMKFRCIFWLCLELIIHSLIGFTPYVDNFAHLGGLLYGLLVAFMIMERLPLSFFGKGKGGCHRFRIAISQFFAAALVTSLLLVSSIWLSQSDGVTIPCPDCRYISCAPFPFWTEDKWWSCDGCDAVTAELYKNEDGSFYNEIEVFCPDGMPVFGDISEHEYSESDMDDMQKMLPGLCRTLC